MNKTLQKVFAVVILASTVLVAGPWTYINLIKDDAPATLELDNSGNSTVATITDVNGEWAITTGSDSVVGYRVKEILFGQSTEGVGRTTSVSGELSIANNSVTTAAFTVQMGTLMSDAAKRDAQFNGRIMDVEMHPTATFALASPIALPTNASSGDVISAQATGKLTLRGTTKEVQFPVEAQLTGSTFTVVGSITIVFDEWGIPEPGLPGISVEPDGLLEFSLEFSRKS